MKQKKEAEKERFSKVEAAIDTGLKSSMEERLLSNAKKSKKNFYTREEEVIPIDYEEQKIMS